MGRDVRRLPPRTRRRDRHAVPAVHLGRLRRVRRRQAALRRCPELPRVARGRPALGRPDGSARRGDRVRTGQPEEPHVQPDRPRAGGRPLRVVGSVHRRVAPAWLPDRPLLLQPQRGRRARGRRPRRPVRRTRRGSAHGRARPARQTRPGGAARGDASHRRHARPHRGGRGRDLRCRGRTSRRLRARHRPRSVGPGRRARRLRRRRRRPRPRRRHGHREPPPRRGDVAVGAIRPAVGGARRPSTRGVPRLRRHAHADRRAPRPRHPVRRGPRRARVARGHHDRRDPERARRRTTWSPRSPSPASTTPGATASTSASRPAVPRAAIPDRFEAFLPELEAAERDLHAALDDVPGSNIERKRFAIAVHYRQVPEEHHAAVAEAVDRIAPRLHLAAGGGREDDLRAPTRHPVGQGHGAAVAARRDGARRARGAADLHRRRRHRRGRVAASSSNHGLGIVVGREERPTRAHYALDDTDEVRLFLDELRARVGRATA